MVGMLMCDERWRMTIAGGKCRLMWDDVYLLACCLVGMCEGSFRCEGVGCGVGSVRCSVGDGDSVCLLM
jgi:hypothetical protein